MKDRWPLCRRPNECRMAAGSTDADGCWCTTVHVPVVLIERVSVAHQREACICRLCIEESAERDDWPTLASIASARLMRIRRDH